MLILPVELRRSCLSFLKYDAEALRALRLTNKDLSILATEVLFRIAVLNHSDESAGRLMNLMKSPFRGIIHRVVINTSDDPENTGEEEMEVNTSFGQAIVLLKELDKLEAVELKFAPECEADPDWATGVAETEQFRGNVLELLFQGLCQADRPIALTIKNLQDSHDHNLFAREDFLAVRRRLNQLHVQIATECNELCDEAIEAEALHDGFTHALPNIWLKPPTDQLTRLSIFGDVLWGVWPLVDFREIRPFSQLKSLAFGNFTIAFDWQIDWIIAHSSTLQELIFDDCTLVTALSLREEQAQVLFPGHAPTCVEDGETKFLVHVSLRWHAILNRLHAELRQLLHFTLGSGDWSGGQAFEQRYELAWSSAAIDYCMFEHEVRHYGGDNWIGGGNPWEGGHNFGSTFDDMDEVPFPRCMHEDLKAFADVMIAVHERARARL
jgi:hypothetical protein